MPKVSVVIPTYNYGRFVGEAVQSVLEQTYQDFEIMVVDDGSTDNTWEVIKNFQDTRIHYLWQTNRGVSAAQNAVIKASSGKYVTILGADDTYLPQNLELKVKMLDSRPDIGLVCSDAYFIYDDNQSGIDTLWSKKQFKYTGSPVEAAHQPLKELLFRSCFIMPQATMLRREVFTTVGYFDESLPTHEDWDLMVRVVQHFSAEAINIPLLRIRRHTTNLTGNQEKVYQGAVAAINKAIRCGAFAGNELKILKQRLTLEHIRFGRWALLQKKESEARKALFAGIKLNPWNPRVYVYLVSSILGNRVFSAVRSYRKKLNHHLVRGYSPGGRTL